MDVNVDVSGILIQTKRLVLRPWRKTDLSDFFAYASQPGVGEMAGWPHHRSKRTTRKILGAFLKAKTSLAIVNRQENKVIGSLGMYKSWANEDYRYKHLREKEIGFVLSRDYWGLGLTPEAVSAMIDYCFAALDIEALTCGHFLENTQSKRVIEKCGFAYIMECEHYATQLKKHFTAARYIIIRSV